MDQATGKLVGMDGDRVWLMPSSRGFLVERVQSLLGRSGLGCKVDGAYGKVTQGVVQRFQALAGIPVTGHVDGVTWSRLSGSSDPPSLEVRCASVVAIQQGLGSSRVVVDGAAPRARELKAGFWGLSSRGAFLFDLLSRLLTEPVVEVIGKNRAQLIGVASKWDKERQTIWTESAWLDGDTAGEWMDALAFMLERPECRGHQVDVFHELVWPRALSLFRALSLHSEVAMAAVCWLVGSLGKRATGFRGSTGIKWFVEWAAGAGVDMDQLELLLDGKVGSRESWAQLGFFGIDGDVSVDLPKEIKLIKGPAPYEDFGVRSAGLSSRG